MSYSLLYFKVHICNKDNGDKKVFFFKTLHKDMIEEDSPN